MKTTYSQKAAVLTALFILFIAPMLLALYFHYNPRFLMAVTTNKGNFVKGGFKLPIVSKRDSWKLVLWMPGECKENCLKELDRLARLRLALGRRLYGVEQWLLSNQQTSLSSAAMQFLLQNDIKFHTLPAESQKLVQLLELEGSIFIVSPTGDVVLSYRPEAHQADIFHDLKQLVSNLAVSGGESHAG